MPWLRHLKALGGSEQIDQGIIVVRVDVLPRRLARDEFPHEGAVRVTPLLRETAPVIARQAAEGGGAVVVAVFSALGGGPVGELVGYGGAPVDSGAEDVKGHSLDLGFDKLCGGRGRHDGGARMN
ncbi:hypothetical protein HYQ46_010180 [Verticillium longisporum]|nr:hypothetical protein HYQ46_010180 [Verticillium longisporum]